MEGTITKVSRQVKTTKTGKPYTRVEVEPGGWLSVFGDQTSTLYPGDLVRYEHGGVPGWTRNFEKCGIALPSPVAPSPPLSASVPSDSPGYLTSRKPGDPLDASEYEQLVVEIAALYRAHGIVDQRAIVSAINGLLVKKQVDVESFLRKGAGDNRGNDESPF